MYGVSSSPGVGGLLSPSMLCEFVRSRAGGGEGKTSGVMGPSSVGKCSAKTGGDGRVGLELRSIIGLKGTVDLERSWSWFVGANWFREGGVV